MIKFAEFWEKYRADFIKIIGIKFFGISIIPKKARLILETIVLAIDTALGLVGQFKDENISYSRIIKKPDLADIMVNDIK